MKMRGWPRYHATVFLELCFTIRRDYEHGEFQHKGEPYETSAQ